MGLGFRYEVIAPIGAGGMGQVFRVFDRDLGREVAAKTILPDRNDHDFLTRFVQEAQATSQLEHPNIIPIHDFGLTATGHLYFTMKYVQGHTLAEVIAELRAQRTAVHLLYSWVRRLQIIQMVCEALAFAHERGVFHRDLKPDNIMVGSLGEVLVMDWGLAKVSTVSEVSRDPSRAGPVPSRGVASHKRPVSHADIILGTPAYMPPEQVESGRFDAQSDVYAIGAVMYELLTLSPPHTGSTTLEVLDSVRSRTPPEPETLVVGGQGRVPREVSLIIMRAISRDRTTRYVTALDLRDDILRYLEGLAQVVCVQTALKRSLSLFGTFVDNHGKLAIILVTACVVVFLVTMAQLVLAVI